MKRGRKDDRFLPGNKVRDLRGGPGSPVWRVIEHYDNGDAEMVRLRRVDDGTDVREIRCPDFYGEAEFFQIIPAVPSPEPARADKEKP